MALGTVRDSPIKCIFFCEFHPTAGPKIMYQVPVNYISEETFSAISVYLIPKPELQHKLITVNMCEMKVIGYPVGIDSAEYDRNRLMFNLCFVCDAKMRTIQYEPIVRKLANYLTTLEQETNFIRNDAKKCQLPEIMSKILHDLNIKRSCSIPINESTTIYLKVTTVHEAPRLVSDHDVPIFTASRPACTPSQWDLTTQQWDITAMQILPFIDGFRHVAKIAVEADVEVSLVKECIRNMLYYGIVQLIPLFLYSAVYATTPEIRTLATDTHVQKECISYVARQGRPRPTFRSIFEMYCSFHLSNSVRDVCARTNPHSLGIDERKLVQYGVMKGLLRRLHKYPIDLKRAADSTSKIKSVSKYFDGAHSYDDICAKTGMSYKELDDILDKDPNVCVCWK
ncbi:GATOR1 complex protein NPRL2-like isoform X1 [Rhipicephalus microplus]|uniref:Putative nitrogen permease regulator 2-like protein n=3 Tax=Rhipicephalus microplus TaxID=6941 RepID=A0A6G5AC77_RHIMP|nr:GATOR complex protein NPRL2-like isoform X1 [Rhipicephalus microplus]